MSRLKERYQQDVIPALKKEFGYSNVMAVPKIQKVVVNMGLGEATSNVKLIGEGAAELKINRGPGYRVYFGWDGKVLVILLGGGTKRRQQNDIEAALRRWRDYKKRKRSEG